MTAFEWRCFRQAAPVSPDLSAAIKTRKGENVFHFSVVWPPRRPADSNDNDDNLLLLRDAAIAAARGRESKICIPLYPDMFTPIGAARTQTGSGIAHSHGRMPAPCDVSFGVEPCAAHYAHRGSLRAAPGLAAFGSRNLGQVVGGSGHKATTLRCLGGHGRPRPRERPWTASL